MRLGESLIVPRRTNPNDQPVVQHSAAHLTPYEEGQAAEHPTLGHPPMRPQHLADAGSQLLVKRQAVSPVVLVAPV